MAQLKAMLSSEDINQQEGMTEELRAWMEEKKESDSPYDAEKWQSILKNVLNVDKEPVPVKQITERPVRRYFTLIRYAASILLLIGISTGIYFFLNQDESQSENNQFTSIPPNDIAPGYNQAVLTLSDGTTIRLDSANIGSLAQQGESRIIKLEDGQLAYEKGAPNTAIKEVQFNSIATPRGGQYQLILSDGSKVWLNAASSIRFPASFTGNERNVEITGEVYFEVAHNATQPFIVKANEVDIKVLGTSFNVNAYEDERSIKTTLLEGSVKVSEGNQSTTIIPGEQAQISLSGIKIWKNVDLESVVAWKNGYFLLSGTSLESLMKQISRWYDVDVFYNGKIAEKKFGGSINRNVKLSTFLEALKVYGIRSKLEGKKLILSED